MALKLDPTEYKKRLAAAQKSIASGGTTASKFPAGLYQGRLVKGWYGIIKKTGKEAVTFDWMITQGPEGTVGETYTQWHHIGSDSDFPFIKFVEEMEQYGFPADSMDSVEKMKRVVLNIHTTNLITEFELVENGNYVNYVLVNVMTPTGADTVTSQPTPAAEAVTEEMEVVDEVDAVEDGDSIAVGDTVKFKHGAAILEGKIEFISPDFSEAKILAPNPNKPGTMGRFSKKAEDIIEKV